MAGVSPCIFVYNFLTYWILVVIIDGLGNAPLIYLYRILSKGLIPAASNPFLWEKKIKL